MPGIEDAPPQDTDAVKDWILLRTWFGWLLPGETGVQAPLRGWEETTAEEEAYAGGSGGHSA